VHDYSRFLYALWKNKLPGAKEMKRLMALPGPDRIVRGARALPKGTRTYNKTGSTSRLCGDMGIVLVRDGAGLEYPYTVIGVIEKSTRAKNYTQWIRSRGKVIGEVSGLVYAGIAKRHGI
jgi:beta-lactamase class A